MDKSLTWKHHINNCSVIQNNNYADLKLIYHVISESYLPYALLVWAQN